ncbi:MAG: helix-turn-helix transcriptional regulator [Clostridiales bacterium]|nr:helix-turn-helix transcriptional regulator [Clostridiales bacterium]
MNVDRKNYINSVNLNIHTDFPYLVLDVINDKSYPRNPGFHVMHWHEDLQFIYVLDGAIEVKTLDTSIRICSGEGLFINKNVVHYVGRLGNCHYNSFLFPSHFLEFYAQSPAKDFVDSVITNDRLPFVCFTSACQWEKEIIEILQQLVQIEKNKTTFYVYEIFVRLSSLWLIMIKNIALPPKNNVNIIHLRMQKILRFIEDHYSEDITLTDLSMSANISKSECSRCFKASLNTTPYKYLTEYRLSKAAQLLKTTDEPVGNIAAAVGFHLISHFGKCFREKTGYSPKTYRNMENNP